MFASMFVSWSNRFGVSEKKTEKSKFITLKMKVKDMHDLVKVAIDYQK